MCVCLCMNVRPKSCLCIATCVRTDMYIRKNYYKHFININNNNKFVIRLISKGSISVVKNLAADEEVPHSK